MNLADCCVKKFYHLGIINCMVGIRKIFFLLSFVFAMQFATAQRSDRILQRAGLAYENLEYYNAASLYERYYKADSSDQKVLLRLADCYWNMRQYELARAWYSKVSKNALFVNDTLTKRFAELSAMAGDYQLAGEILSNLKNIKQGFREDMRETWKQIAIQAMTHDVFRFLKEVYRYDFKVPLGVGIVTGKDRKIVV